VNRTAEALANAFPGQAQPATIEIPFASAYKWSGAAFDGEGSLRGSYVMGAPEMLVPHIQDGDALAEQAAAWTAEGMRVLIFAHHDQPLQPPRDSEAPALPAGLRPLGWLIFSDELRPDARQVLDQFRQAGITLKLISGDNPQTVAALARMAGISPDAEVISGLDLAALPEGEFDLAVEQTTVFGRITPEQKQRIVQTLRAQGHYVAMIGDGVNDVLSLKQAQMGIAMESGSQATRAVADLVLLGDRFSILPETIKEGQRILNGMQDVMRLFLTRTLYAALLIIIAGIIGTEFPFTPRHNAILTTLPVGLPAVVLTLWARSGRPQQNLFASIAGFVLPAGFSITVTTLVVYLLYLDEPVQLQRTVLTTTALLCSLLIIIFAGHSVADWESGRRLSPSRRRIALALTMLAAYLVIFAIPPLREFFELNTLSWENLFVVALAVAIWAVVVRVLWRYDVFERILVPAE
jgi:cation-transporting ATPase E